MLCDSNVCSRVALILLRSVAHREATGQRAASCFRLDPVPDSGTLNTRWSSSAGVNSWHFFSLSTPMTAKSLLNRLVLKMQQTFLKSNLMSCFTCKLSKTSSDNFTQMSLNTVRWNLLRVLRSRGMFPFPSWYGWFISCHSLIDSLTNFFTSNQARCGKPGVSVLTARLTDPFIVSLYFLLMDAVCLPFWLLIHSSSVNMKRAEALGPRVEMSPQRCRWIVTLAAVFVVFAHWSFVSFFLIVDLQSIHLFFERSCVSSRILLWDWSLPKNGTYHYK